MNINLSCAINKLGYGQVGTNVLSSLVHAGHNVSLFPINPHNIEAEEKHHSNIQVAANNALFFDSAAPSLRIFHQWLMAESFGSGPRIGWPIFELDQLTKLEWHHLNSLDKIIVCSQWAYDVLVTNHIRPKIEIVPLGYDPDIFNTNQVINKSQSTVFINIGKWEIRKGHHIIIEAFNKAFNSNDNVELWMINDNPLRPAEENQKWRDLYLNSKLGQAGKIKIIERQDTQAQLAYIMRKADFGIFPALAEGWNLEVLELMACGVPSIVTNYSAHTQFCNSKTSMLIDIDETEEAFDGIWFKPGGIVNQGNWAKFGQKQEEQTIAHMKLCHQLKQEGDNLITSARDNNILQAKDYTWTKSVNQLVTFL